MIQIIKISILYFGNISPTQRDISIESAYKNAFLTRWLFDVEIFIRLKKHYGSKKVIMESIFEQALVRWVHMDDSKLGMKDALQIPLMLVNIWFSYTIVERFMTTVQHANTVAFQNNTNDYQIVEQQIVKTQLS